MLMAGKKTTLLLIRHGETTWNAQKKLQGNTDVPLTAKGRKQAQAIARYLRDYPIDVIYSSPLKRARITAQAINTHHKVALFTDVALLERGFGKLEGRPYDEIFKHFPRFGWPAALLYPWYSPLDSERLTDVDARVGRFFDKILTKHKGKTIAIVSHGVTLRSSITQLLNLPRSFNFTYSMENASLTLIQLKEGGEREIHLLASVVHLRKK